MKLSQQSYQVAYMYWKKNNYVNIWIFHTPNPQNQREETICDKKTDET